MRAENMVHDHKCRVRVRVWIKVMINDYGFIFKHKDLFDVRSDWVYSEAGHGKYPCDGIGVRKRGQSRQYRVDNRLLRNIASGLTQNTQYIL